ncbi:hypothetical protein AB0E67_20455 [Streptomyces sp. NPDC032161]|uniref:hypothetical protein n=1 Tax=unclassified Streptomyces TaxID=2593676 RepID=UPI003406B7DF
MHPEAHLLLHHQRSTELRQQATEFLLTPAEPGTGLRARLGWFLVESGLRILPRHSGHPGHASALPGTA